MTVSHILKCSNCEREIRVRAAIYPTFGQIEIDCECHGFGRYEFDRRA